MSRTEREKRWDRIILNMYWLVLGLELIAQLLIYLLGSAIEEQFQVTYYVTHYVIWPDVLLLLIIGAVETAARKFPDYTESTLIIGSGVVALTVIYFIDSDIRVAPIIACFPLLLSMLYFNRKYLIFSTVGCFCYIGFMIWDRKSIDTLFASEIIVLGSIFLATCFTGLGIIHRGREIMSSLEKTVKSEQELMIRNVVMDRLSKIDALTDLYNHKTFHEYLDKLVEQQHARPFPMQVAVLDIDNFKQVNDMYGHWVGDVALKQVAACIQQHLDTNDFAARYGGEEFVIIFTSKSPDVNQEQLEHLRLNISHTAIEEMEGSCVTVSIGTHEYQCGDNKETVFQLADQALYEAKRTGKNKVVAC